MAIRRSDKLKAAFFLMVTAALFISMMLFLNLCDACSILREVVFLIQSRLVQKILRHQSFYFR